MEVCLMDKERKVYKRFRQLVQATPGMDRVIENIRAVTREVTEEKPYAAVGLGTAYLALRQPGVLSF